MVSIGGFVARGGGNSTSGRLWFQVSLLFLFAIVVTFENQREMDLGSVGRWDGRVRFSPESGRRTRACSKDAQS
jgi:hypothetical protein